VEFKLNALNARMEILTGQNIAQRITIEELKRKLQEAEKTINEEKEARKLLDSRQLANITALVLQVQEERKKRVAEIQFLTDLFRQNSISSPEVNVNVGEKQISKSQTTVKTTQSTPKEPPKKSISANDENHRTSDLELRRRRVVVYNIGKVSNDKEEVMKVIEVLGVTVEEKDIKRVYRVGDDAVVDRPLLVEFTQEKLARTILKSKINLKQSNYRKVYINRDKTLEKRERDYQKRGSYNGRKRQNEASASKVVVSSQSSSPLSRGSQVKIVKETAKPPVFMNFQVPPLK